MSAFGGNQTILEASYLEVGNLTLYPAYLCHVINTNDEAILLANVYLAY